MEVEKLVVIFSKRFYYGFVVAGLLTGCHGDFHKIGEFNHDDVCPIVDKREKLRRNHPPEKQSDL